MTEAERLAQRLEEDLDLSRWGQTIADQAAALLRSQAAEIEALKATVDKLLAHCPDMECTECGAAVCPNGEPLHFHHDGCPQCDAEADAAIDAARQS